MTSPYEQQPENESRYVADPQPQFYEPFFTTERIMFITMGILVTLVGLLLIDFSNSFVFKIIGVITALIGLLIDALGCGVINLSQYDD